MTITTSGRGLAVPSLGAVMAALVFFASPSRAENGIWTNTATGNWSDTNNWNGWIVADGAGNTADFSTIDIAADLTNHLDSARTIGNLIFGDIAANTPGGWILDNNGVAGNILTLAVPSGSPTITVNALSANKTAKISGVVTGTSGFTKSGPGWLSLSGTANTFSSSAKFVVNGGTLSFGGLGSMGTAPAVLTPDWITVDGATLTYDSNQSNNNTNDKRGMAIGAGGCIIAADMGSWDGPISGTGKLYIAPSQFRLTGGGSGGTAGAYDATYSGDTVILSGGQVCPYRRLSMQNSTLDLSLQANGIRNLNGISSIVLGGLKGTQNQDLNLINTTLSIGNNNTNTTYSGVLSNGGSTPIVKIGTGALTLSGANTYSGGTTISNGTLLVSNTSGSGTGTGAVAVRAGGTLGGSGSISGVVTVEGGGHLAPGTNGIGTLTLSGAGACLVFTNNAVLDCDIGGSNESYTNDLVNLTDPTSTIRFGATAVLNLHKAAGATLDDLNGKTFVLFTYAGDDPQIRPEWLINYGTTGWSGGYVTIDAASNQVLLHGRPPGMTIIVR